jgi:hypothetical protein
MKEKRNFDVNAENVPRRRKVTSPLKRRSRNVAKVIIQSVVQSE